MLRWGVVWAFLCWGLLGCAQPPQLPYTKQVGDRTAWMGRIALQIENSTSSSRSFSAAFELHGSLARGQLKLFSPLGNTLAQLDWEPEQARLQTADQPEPYQSSSLKALLQQATGAQLPVEALFDWLSGIPTAYEDWHADLTAIAQGKIVATRQSPESQATLRIVLEP